MSIADWLDSQIQRHTPPGPDELALALGVASRIAAAGVALRDGRGLVFGFDMSSEDRMLLSPVSSRCFATVAQWHALFRSKGFTNGCLSLERNAAAGGFDVGPPIETPPSPLEQLGFRGRLRDVPLRGVESGVFRVQADGPTLRSIASQTLEQYQGPQIRELDVVVPSGAAGWILLGGWTTCFQSSFSATTTAFGKALHTVEALHNAGISIDGEGVTVATTNSSRVATSSMIAVQGELPFPIGRYSPETRVRFHAGIEMIEPYVGLHMKVPHWFGYGVTRDGDRISSVTPYLNLRMTASGTIELTAMQEIESIQNWLDAFEDATASFERH